MKKAKLIWAMIIFTIGLFAVGSHINKDEKLDADLDSARKAAISYSVKKWSAICLARSNGIHRYSEEVFSQVRKYGDNGPVGLDGYQGPVIVVYCEGDEVPETIMRALAATLRETQKT